VSARMLIFDRLVGLGLQVLVRVVAGLSRRVGAGSTGPGMGRSGRGP
jgi:hypothetical protein